MATKANLKSNLLYIHPGCGPALRLHFDSRMKKPAVKETRPNTALDGLIECALKIAHQDAALRRNLKAAIQRDDVAGTLQAACSLLDIEPPSSIRALILSHTKAA